jgi:hypothetical protein
MIPFYPPLDVQTNADPFTGVCSTEALVNGAVRRAIRCVGVADKGTLVSVESLAHLGTARGVRPLAGATLSLRHPGEEDSTLLLYSSSSEGWKNLVTLCSMPWVSPEAIAAHASGLACITGIRGCKLWRLLRQGKPWEADLHLRELAVIFGPSSTYVALGNNPHPKALWLRQVSRETATRANIACIALPSIKYVYRKGFAQFDAMLALQEGRTLQSIARADHLVPWAYWKDQRELSHDYLDEKHADPETIYPLTEKLLDGVPDWVGKRLTQVGDTEGDVVSLNRRIDKFLAKASAPEWKSVLHQERDFLIANALTATVMRALGIVDALRAQGVRARFTGDFACLNLAHLHAPSPGEFNPYSWHNPSWPTRPAITIEVDSSRLHHASETLTRGLKFLPILEQIPCSAEEALHKAALVSGLSLKEQIALEHEFHAGAFSLSDQKAVEVVGFNRAIVNAATVARTLYGQPLTRPQPSLRFACFSPQVDVPRVRRDDQDMLAWNRAGDYLGGEYQIVPSQGLMAESIAIASGRETPAALPPVPDDNALLSLRRYGFSSQDCDSVRRAILAHSSEDIFKWQKRFDTAAAIEGVQLAEAQQIFNAMVKGIQAPSSKPVQVETIQLTAMERILESFETGVQVGNLIPPMLARGYGIMPPDWSNPKFQCSWEGNILRLGLNVLCGSRATSLLSAWGGLALKAEAASQWHGYFEQQAPGLWDLLAAGGWLPKEVVPSSPDPIAAWQHWGWSWPHHPHDAALTLDTQRSQGLSATILTQHDYCAWKDHARVKTGKLATTLSDEDYLVEPDPRNPLLVGAHYDLTVEHVRRFLNIIAPPAPAESEIVEGALIFWPHDTSFLPEENLLGLAESARRLPQSTLALQFVQRQEQGALVTLGEVQGVRSVWWWRALADYLPPTVEIETTTRD